MIVLKSLLDGWSNVKLTQPTTDLKRSDKLLHIVYKAQLPGVPFTVLS